MTDGPFETEAQARATVAHIYAAAHASISRGVFGELNHKLLCEALSAAGVDLGAYDHRIVRWMAGWEPELCAVVAGWVTRAAGNVDDGPPEPERDRSYEIADEDTVTGEPGPGGGLDTWGF